LMTRGGAVVVDSPRELAAGVEPYMSTPRPR
jgi:hypothetical protein